MTQVNPRYENVHKARVLLLRHQLDGSRVQVKHGGVKVFSGSSREQPGKEYDSAYPGIFAMVIQNRVHCIKQRGDFFKPEGQ